MTRRWRVAMSSVQRLGTMLVLMLLMDGCGSDDDKWINGRPPVYPASGLIFYNGEPLDGANVIFSPAVAGAQAGGEGSVPGAAGRTDDEGRFTLTTFGHDDGAPAGLYKVTVLKAESVVIYRPDDPDHDQIPLKQEQKHLIPEKYSIPEESGLEAEVAKSDENEFLFELTDAD